MALRDRLEQLQEAIEERTGYAVEKRERLEILESRSVELGATRRELDALAWTALNYVGGAPQELQAVERRKLAQKSRIVWMKDPQAGAAVDLMNDFVFGRGIPKPKANDPEVQKVIDDAWDDPDNQLVLTSYPGQLALGTDLSLQSNLFVLVFDSGEDGKVKLGLLDHDAVENVVRDPENRLRIMYFVARHFKQEWDFEHDCPKKDLVGNGGAPDARLGHKGKGEIRYYEHWRNVEAAEEGVDDPEDPRSEVLRPPAMKMGEGRVFHIAINRTSEMAFGHPVMDRLLRWYTAYNQFIDARLDIIQAKAAFVMKRKVKGTPNQLAKMAQQAVSRRSALGASVGDPDLQGGPRPGSILNENESVTHEDMSLDTGAGNAAQDSQMIRAQVSAATRFPQSYYGDATNSSLATATSLELPVLKAVEARQEFFEALIRFFVDRCIERAVDAGVISDELSPDEVEGLQEARRLRFLVAQGAHVAAPGEDRGRYIERVMSLLESYEDQNTDEQDTKRDLGYEFKMPSPLRRMMSDLITSIQNIARTFDPNNTNMELSRALLTVALGEGLEVEDPAGMVDRIFPPGYVDPAVAAAQQAQAPPEGSTPFGTDPFGEFGPVGPPAANGKTPSDPAGNPYSAPQRAQSPEKTGISESVIVLNEARAARSAGLRARMDARRAELDRQFDEVTKDVLPHAQNGNTNGNVNGNNGR